jgi:hypothetical protein
VEEGKREDARRRISSERALNHDAGDRKAGSSDAMIAAEVYRPHYRLFTIQHGCRPRPLSSLPALGIDYSTFFCDCPPSSQPNGNSLRGTA